MLRQILDILTFQAGYNTSVVLVGTSLLGIAAAVVGVFAVLRRRALISDAISHATLPGVALGFLVALALGGDGRQLEVLLLGALASGALGVLAVQWIEANTRLPADAAIGTVLSVSYAVGVVLLSYIQTLPVGGQAGLNSFLLGSTAAMLRGEAELIALAAAVVLLVVLLVFKELAAVAFDREFAAALGWPVGRLDLLLLGLLLAVVALGLKTVGLILIVALIIVPPVAARFWTDRLSRLVPLAALFGALSGYLGAALSALLPRLPAGAVIVLTAGAFFIVSLLAAPRRGVVVGLVRRLVFRFALRRRAALVSAADGRLAVGRATRLLWRLRGWLGPHGALTAAGQRAAAEAVRQERLWQRYLADFPQDALATEGWATERIERVLPADLVALLEQRIAAASGPPR